MPIQQDIRPDRRIDLALAGGLLLVTLAVFWPVRHFDWINYDDFNYVPRNPRVLSGLTLSNLRWDFSTATFDYWQPLTWLSYQIDVSLWGPRPGPIHLENAVLHAVSAGLWFLLWSRTTGRRGPSLLVAALFAVHPTRVESVAWIAERKDVLSSLLLVLSMLAYAGYARRPGAGRISAIAFYSAACAAYALALMAKPMVVTAPALLLLLDVWPLRRIEFGKNISAKVVRRLLLEKTPFAVLAAVATVLTLGSTGQAKAIPSLAQLTISNRIDTVLAGYARYLGMLIVPTRLSIFYPYRFDQPVAVRIACLGLLGVLTWLAWRVRRGRPYALVGWAWFVICLSPVIGILQSGEQSIADRFVYVAAVGPFVVFTWAASDILAAVSTRSPRGAKLAGPVLSAAILLASVIGTRLYLPAFFDSVTVFSYAENSIATPDFTIENHLGDAFIYSGQPDLALPHLLAAVEMSPGDPDTRAHLGAILLQAFPAEALTHLLVARKTRTNDPDLELLIGNACTATHRPEEAAAAYRRALALRPDFPQARIGLEKVAGH